jgi:dTDP-4-dehydrorhamnose 3,5-epimerase
MQLIPTPIPDLFLVQPKVFEDPRGYFYESYNRTVFEQAGIYADFVQDNQSLSHKGVLRGLHLQNPPHAQGKLVRVIKGSVFDVAVDIRKDSPTYGKWFGHDLTEQNRMMMWIPPGFAHGFLTLEDNTIFSYKCTGYYSKASEDCILWNDPDLGIDWGVKAPLLSEKDKQGKAFREFTSLF